MTAAESPAEVLPVIMRPNGKPYRPRKIQGNAVADENQCVIAVIVFGTHDAEQARPLAEDCARFWVDSSYTAANPQAGWWRSGYHWGEPTWLDDEVRGRAGVRFEVVEATS